MGMSYYYVDKNWNPIYGEEAKKKLEEYNDEIFLDKDAGIIAVSKERWKAAQAAEKNGWMNLWLYQTQDRNDDHYNMFDQYMALKNNTFENAIELGCGPFTNIRYIGGVCKIIQCSLLDPLVESYLEHPYCSYDRNRIRCITNKELSVTQIIPMPIEEYQVSQQYDLVVMINVIQHCYDVQAIFANIGQMLKNDGYFVFHDYYYDHDIVSQSVKTSFDQGHPLKVDRKLLDHYLTNMFNPIFKLLAPPKEAGLDRIYFIGKKKAFEEKLE